jgi:hypothetical protein
MNSLEKKRVYVFLIGLIFIISLFAQMNFVVGDDAGLDIEGFFGNIASCTSEDGTYTGVFDMQETTKISISRYLLVFLILLLVYSILGFVGIFDNSDLIRFVVSGIFAFISFVFVPDNLIRYILLSYEGFGVIVSTFFPLFVLMAFSFKLRYQISNRNMVALVGTKILYLTYALYILVRFIGMAACDYSTYSFAILLLGMLGVIIWSFWGENALIKGADEDAVEKYKREIALAKKKTETDAVAITGEKK